MLTVHEYFNRIVDDMPVTWCYDVVDSTKKYCPLGSTLDAMRLPKARKKMPV